MNRKYTLIVVVGALALIALAFWQRDTAPVDLAKGTPTPTPGPIMSLAQADVQEVTVTGPAGKQATLTRAGEGWQVDGQLAADTVDGTISNVVKLAALQSLPTELKPADYGFESPTLTVTLKTAAGATTTFHVGDDVVGEASSSYVLMEGAGQPLLIVNNADLKTMLGWLDTKPLAPTPTPEGGGDAGASGTPGLPGMELPSIPLPGGSGTPSDSPPEATPTPAS
jgi:hypothetical protein